ncbi:MAG: hypothetical protein CBE00_10810 [Planctomycetaceae bacterium TMED240]|nr:hypothetical protein [Rhodopirellula sp.]OUX05324.1 MAG: hypothetical protein CBE00_10810 [Planctomycetaceae bacterium TMED240]
MKHLRTFWADRLHIPEAQVMPIHAGCWMQNPPWLHDSSIFGHADTTSTRADQVVFQAQAEKLVRIKLMASNDSVSSLSIWDSVKHAGLRKRTEISANSVQSS